MSGSLHSSQPGRQPRGLYRGSNSNQGAALTQLTHGLSVTVSHYPPGCSKWNPTEHRLFSYISSNWAGQPLRTFETMMGYIRDTTTTTGLKVSARLLEGVSEVGKRVADEVMKSLNIEHNAVCGRWNYTIHPRSRAAEPA